MTAPTDDPLLTSSRREAVVCAVVWLIATLYSVGYSYLFGYGRAAESLTFVFGFPDWIFWGLVTPWIACTVFSCWFCLFFMTDEVLEDDPSAPTPES